MPDYPVVPPHEAGAQIRVLATQLYEVLTGYSPTGQGHFITTDKVDHAWYQVASKETKLRVAMNGRRLSEMRPAFDDYRTALLEYRAGSCRRRPCRSATRTRTCRC